MDQIPEQHFKQYAHAPYSLWLDSADTTHPNAKTSLIFTDPVLTIESKNGMVKISGETIGHADPFDVLKDRMAAHPSLFAAGLFGYDLGRLLETLPACAQDNDMPDMAVGLYEKIYTYNNPPPPEPAGISGAGMQSAKKAAPIDWRPSTSAEIFQSSIQTVIDYIHAGDIFQANIAQHYEAVLPAGFDPFEHYLHLRARSPAPFCGYFNLGPLQISSTSPERFLQLKKRRVETKPIKGTLPRDQDPAALVNSEKDRAENIMIVDLLRNDLSKVCTPGSITVEKLCALESFASVHHLVSTITGDLRDGQSATDLLKACFPGGSITGAPKIRAMEIIEELEPQRRGPYTGCLGYITPGGDMDTNILIRTLIYKDGKACLSVGGGITARSNPQDEYQETLDKAAAIFESFKTRPNTEQAA